jgi:hypothetical protein
MDLSAISYLISLGFMYKILYSSVSGFNIGTTWEGIDLFDANSVSNYIL